MVAAGLDPKKRVVTPEEYKNVELLICTGVFGGTNKLGYNFVMKKSHHQLKPINPELPCVSDWYRNEYLPVKQFPWDIIADSFS